MRDEITSHVETEMTCQELVQLVTEYLEGKLSLSEQFRFDAHLRTCSACAVYIEQLRTTIGMVGKLSRSSISPEAERELLATFRRWKSGSPQDH
jgi:anti-sigma factor RsiW